MQSTLLVPYSLCQLNTIPVLQIAVELSSSFPWFIFFGAIQIKFYKSRLTQVTRKYNRKIRMHVQLDEKEL